MYTFDDNIISDLHKDARGFRPSVAWMHGWATSTNEEKQGIWDDLVDEMNRAMEQQAEDEARALVEFRKTVAAQMELCSCKWTKAVDYLADAEDITLDNEQDFDYFLWHQGIGYEDRINIRKLYERDTK